MAIVTGNDILVQILKMFGVDDCSEIRKATITIEVDNVVMIDVERYARPEIDKDGNLILPIELEEYELSAVKKKDVIQIQKGVSNGSS
jgi:hypothetical protein